EIAGQKDVVELKRQIARLPADESLAQRLSLGKLVKERLDAKKRAVQERILPPWEQVAHRTVRHQIRHDAMVVNAAFLLDSEGRRKLEALVNKADREEGGSLNLRIIGPLPPYSFSTVQLRRAHLAELDAARRELALPERIAPHLVADAARSAMRRAHPDTDTEDASLPEKFERVKTAVELLKRFCPPQGLDLRDTQQREFLLVEPIEAQ
ncbi:MAG: GvpL/GvpF family gas vesicle protein, partial [Candidatus Brocadiae bacterium]|nr:GvpL/GvpF family gas vesicle protein [Candidatus Brocadiia bacterium]